MKKQIFLLGDWKKKVVKILWPQRRQWKYKVGNAWQNIRWHTFHSEFKDNNEKVVVSLDTLTVSIILLEWRNHVCEC